VTKRVTIYTRVSTAKKRPARTAKPTAKSSETSTKRQLERCEAYAKSQGWEVVERRTDRGISGFRRGVERPGWRAVLADVEAERTDVVLVHAMDRAGRNAADLLKFVELCRDHGVAFVSATQPIDTGSNYGSIIIAVLAAVAEIESAIKSERALSWVEDQREQGLRTGGHRPFGFQVVEGKLVPDEREAKMIREAARRILGDGTWLSVARTWNEDGVTTPQGSRWTGQKVRQVVSNERHVGTTLTRRDHSRLMAKVDAATFERNGYQRTSQYMLTGLVTCSLCGARMTGRPGRAGREYVCKATGPLHLSIPADAVEAVATRRASEAEFVAEEVVDPGTLPAELLAQLNEFEEKLEAFARTAAEAGMSVGEIRAGREPLIAKRDQLQKELDDVPAPREGHGFAALLEDVPEPSEVEWRAIVEEVVEALLIWPGRARSPEDRVSVEWREGARERA